MICRLAIGVVSLFAAAALAAPAGDRDLRPAGARAFAKCTSCHSLEADENLPSGPTLHRIVGRPVAAERTFDFSPALQAFAAQNPRWTPGLLDTFIADPEALVPGTYMSFHGISDPAERAALIDWLKQE